MTFKCIILYVKMKSMCPTDSLFVPRSRRPYWGRTTVITPALHSYTLSRLCFWWSSSPRWLKLSQTHYASQRLPWVAVPRTLERAWKRPVWWPWQMYHSSAWLFNTWCGIPSTHVPRSRFSFVSCLFPNEEAILEFGSKISAEYLAHMHSILHG